MPLAEHDLSGVQLRVKPSGFNSRAPRGARRLPESCPRPAARFNSRAPRGARPLVAVDVTREAAVSIHVPLAEHDFMHHADLSVFFYVSIHVPLAEHDPLSPSAMFG